MTYKNHQKLAKTVGARREKQFETYRLLIKVYRAVFGWRQKSVVSRYFDDIFRAHDSTP